MPSRLGLDRWGERRAVGKPLSDAGPAGLVGDRYDKPAVPKHGVDVQAALQELLSSITTEVLFQPPDRGLGGEGALRFSPIGRLLLPPWIERAA
jgi:hypothetical protein